MLTVRRKTISADYSQVKTLRKFLIVYCDTDITSFSVPGQFNKCAECGIKFPKFTYFEEHMAHHNRQPPGRFQCPHCSFSLDVINGMARHVKIAHSGVCLE